MIPKEQKVEYYWDTDVNDNTLPKACDRLVKLGWVIQQIIPITKSKCYWILVCKY